MANKSENLPPGDGDSISGVAVRLSWDEVRAHDRYLTVPAHDPTLPLADIPWEVFERLCAEIVNRTSGGNNVHIYGRRGQRQYGIDIVEFDSSASEPSLSETHVYQVKRYRQMTPAKLRRAVEIYADSDRFRARTFTVMTSAPVTDRKLIDELASLRKEYAERFDLRLLGPDQIQVLLRELPTTVQAVFGPAMAEALCGRPGDDGARVDLLPGELNSAIERHLATSGTGLQSLSSSLLRMDRTQPSDGPDVDWVVPELVEERVVDGEDDLAGLIARSMGQQVTELWRYTVEDLVTALTDPHCRLGGGSSVERETRYQVAAGPGSGKTTLARQIHRLLVQKAREAGDSPSPLPVLVPAAAVHADLPGAVEEALKLTTRSDAAARHLAEQPFRLVVIVDALDQTQRTRDLERTLSEWPGPLLLMGRLDTEAFARSIVQRQLHLSEITRNDAQGLFSNYLRLAGFGGLAQDEARRVVNNANARNLITSPLLVTLLAWWWSENLRSGE